jgi:RimJ/RimL family protein N-acetyltransferase
MPDSIKDVRLDSFDPARHTDLVATWMRAPHVAKWWGDPDKSLREVLERPNGGGDALIVADGLPVGYVRWQVPTRRELDEAGLQEVPDSTIDIDIAIGEPEYIGLGIGSRAIGLILEDLDADTDLKMVILATSVDNFVAIRAYEKAGFDRRRTFDDPEGGMCWLLALDMPRT